jgi:hypothetical protein
LIAGGWMGGVYCVVGYKLPKSWRPSFFEQGWGDGLVRLIGSCLLTTNTLICFSECRNVIGCTKDYILPPPLPPAINTCINSSQLLFSWSNYALDFLRNVPARRRRRAPLRRSSPARRESTSAAVVPGRDSLHDIGLARGIEGQEEVFLFMLFLFENN